MRKQPLLPALAACAALLLPVLAVADAQLRLPDFRHLQGKATDSVDITLDGFLMRLAKKFAAQEAEQGDPDMALLKNVDSVRVRTFEFDSDNAYSREDIDAVRRQLAAPGWSALLQAHSRAERTDVDIYINSVDGKIRGLAVLAAEPRSFAIVNIVGSIDMDDLAKLEGKFGIPNISQAE